MAGPELLLISAGLQVFQGIQAYQQGKAQAKAANQTAEYNAQLIDQQSEVERQKLKRQQQQFAGSQRTRAAASGASLESFEDVFEDTTQQSLLDLALQDYDAKVRRQQAIYSGQVEASQAKSAGRSGLISGLAGGAGTALIGFGQTSSADFARRTGGQSGFSGFLNEVGSTAGRYGPGF